MAQPVPTRTEAIGILERERRATLELIDRLPARAITTRGLGGGDWSPKDLIGHLESWEQHALDALDAWARGESAPSDVAPGGRWGGASAGSSGDRRDPSGTTPRTIRIWRNTRSGTDPERYWSRQVP
jgi:hypothetical protein